MKPRIRSGRLIAAGIALMLLGLLAPAALATTIVSEQDVVIEEGETVDGNYYAFGSSTQVDGRVNGDLIATGDTIVIGPNGSIAGDLMAAGREIRVQGTVEGDVRSAGFVVEIAGGGAVGGEMMAAGFSLEVEPGATVGGQARLGGYQALLGGQMEDDVWVGAGALELAGSVDGDLRAYIDPSGEAEAPPSFFFPGEAQLERTLQPGLEITAEGSVTGDLVYLQRPGEPLQLPASQVGGDLKPVEQEVRVNAEGELVEGELVEVEPSSPAVDWLLRVLRTFVALVLLGLLILWLLPRLLEGVGERISGEAGPSALWGFMGHAGALLGLVLLLPVTLLLFLILGPLTLAGAFTTPILSASFLTGSLLLFGFMWLRWLARIAFALWLGRELLRRAAPESTLKAWAALLIGGLLYVIVWRLPVIGGLLDLLAIIVAVGAVLRELFARWRGGASPHEGVAMAAAD